MILTLTGTAGAPGTTTTALAMLLAWPRPCLLIEADTTRSSAIMVGYFKGGSVSDRGVVGLVLPARDGSLSLDDLMAQAHEIAPQRWIIPGISRLEQGESLIGTWPVLMGVLRILGESGIDTIIDAGRLGRETPASLITATDVALLVSRTTMPHALAVLDRAPTLLDTAESGALLTGLALIGDHQPLAHSTIAHESGLRVLASLPIDDAAAAHLTYGADYEPARHLWSFGESPLERAPLIAAAGASIARIQSLLERHQSALGIASTQESPDE